MCVTSSNPFLRKALSNVHDPLQSQEGGEVRVRIYSFTDDFTLDIFVVSRSGKQLEKRDRNLTPDSFNNAK